MSDQLATRRRSILARQQRAQRAQRRRDFIADLIAHLFWGLAAGVLLGAMLIVTIDLFWT